MTASNQTTAGDLILVTCAFPFDADAEIVARELVLQRLATAVHVTPTASHFSWDGEQKQVSEYVLDAKTRRGLFLRVVAAIKAHHTYVLPGISFTALAGGTDEYLNWIRASLVGDGVSNA
jgi:periplasmic divalent cation tolerance protein